jgi:hypothetical protein
MYININSPKTFNFERRGTTQEQRMELMREIDPKGFYPSGPPNEWMVDDEHALKFIGLGGRGGMPEGTDHMPNFYQLLVGKHVIRFEARYAFIPDTGGGGVKYQISSAVAPKHLIEQIGFVKQTIIEGLLAEDYSRTMKYSPRFLISAIETNDFEFSFI